MLLTLQKVRTHWYFSFFFFNDTATTEIYTLSLHDALPISCASASASISWRSRRRCCTTRACGDRKSTRLNSSHLVISYAVFCLKKKKSNPLQLLAPITTATFSRQCLLICSSFLFISPYVSS